MAQYGYFQGGSGPSPIPANFGQLATAGSAALQQGIMNASKSIGDALKERSEKAKKIKEGGDIAGRALKMLAKDQDGVLPNGQTLAEIDLMTPQEKINEYQALQGFQSLRGQSAKTESIREGTEGQRNTNEAFQEKNELQNRATEAQIEAFGLNKKVKEQNQARVNDTAGAMRNIGNGAFMPGSREELNAATFDFPNADRTELAEFQALLAKNEKGSWRPQVIDVGGYKMVMTSPSSAQYIGGDIPDGVVKKPGYQEIPDGDGSQGIWDGKKWTSIKHPSKGDLDVRDFDTNNNELLDEGEFNAFKSAAMTKNAMYGMMVGQPISGVEKGMSLPKKQKKTTKGKDLKPASAPTSPRENENSLSMEGFEKFKKQKQGGN